MFDNKESSAVGRIQDCQKDSKDTLKIFREQESRDKSMRFGEEMEVGSIQHGGTPPEMARQKNHVSEAVKGPRRYVAVGVIQKYTESPGERMTLPQLF